MAIVLSPLTTGIHRMPRYVAFLRAINVGGHTVRMDDLRALFASLGYSRVETFIASGNVIFNAESKATASLEKSIEARLLDALGFEVKTFLRTDAQVAAIARFTAFAESRLRAAGALNVGFLAAPLKPAALKTLLTLRTDIDDFHVEGRELFWLCKKRQSESTFSNAVLEKTLGVRATFRGMNTIVKLAAKYPPSTGTGKAGIRRMS